MGNCQAEKLMSMHNREVDEAYHSLGVISEEIELLATKLDDLDVTEKEGLLEFLFSIKDKVDNISFSTVMKVKSDV